MSTCRDVTPVEILLLACQFDSVDDCSVSPCLANGVLQTVVSCKRWPVAQKPVAVLTGWFTVAHQNWQSDDSDGVEHNIEKSLLSVGPGDSQGQCSCQKFGLQCRLISVATDLSPLPYHAHSYCAAAIAFMSTFYYGELWSETVKGISAADHLVCSLSYLHKSRTLEDIGHYPVTQRAGSDLGEDMTEDARALVKTRRSWPSNVLNRSLPEYSVTSCALWLIYVFDPINAPPNKLR